MNILVTGGAGFIGSNLANTLAAKGHKVVVADNLFLGSVDNLTDKVIFEKVDVTDTTALENLFKTYSFDYAFHLAALSSVAMYTDGRAPDPSQWFDVNIGGFVNVAKLCLKHGVKKLVYASTSSLYSGNPLPYHEEQTIRPSTLYETSMYYREIIADTFKKMHGLKAVGLRFFSVYGPNEQHKGVYANLVSQFLWAMKKGEQPVIYGDGSQTRDFTHVSDIVQSFELAVSTDMNGVFNVGTGKSYSINELIDMLNEMLGTSVKPKYIINPLKNYVSHTLADISKIQAFGFRPKVSLENGLTELVKR
jgi:UDP-glucose 4-epimerase